MPAGVQTFNAMGAIVVDSNTLILKTKIIDFGNITAPGGASLATIPNTTVIPSLSNNDISIPPPKINISGNSLSWNYADGTTTMNASLRIMYL